MYWLLQPQVPTQSLKPKVLAYFTWPPCRAHLKPSRYSALAAILKCVHPSRFPSQICTRHLNLVCIFLFSVPASDHGQNCRMIEVVLLIDMSHLSTIHMCDLVHGVFHSAVPAGQWAFHVSVARLVAWGDRDWRQRQDRLSWCTLQYWQEVCLGNYAQLLQRWLAGKSSHIPNHVAWKALNQIVWIPKQETSSVVCQSALCYCYHTICFAEKNPSNPPPAYLIYAGMEPMEFTNLFPLWVPNETVTEISEAVSRLPSPKESTELAVRCDAIMHFYDPHRGLREVPAEREVYHCCVIYRRAVNPERRSQ